jgi:hypothetical protein
MSLLAIYILFSFMLEVCIRICMYILYIIVFSHFIFHSSIYGVTIQVRAYVNKAQFGNQ